MSSQLELYYNKTTTPKQYNSDRQFCKKEITNEDFVAIQKQLEQIDLTVESLKLWVSSMIADGKINKDKLKDIENGI